MIPVLPVGGQLAVMGGMLGCCTDFSLHNVKCAVEYRIPSCAASCCLVLKGSLKASALRTVCFGGDELPPRP